MYINNDSFFRYITVLYNQHEPVSSLCHGKVDDVLAGIGCLRKLELSLVVELEQHGVLWVEMFEVHEVLARVGRGVAAVLTHVQLVPALLVGEVELEAVDLPPVGLQGAALGERFATGAAFVGTDT